MELKTPRPFGPCQLRRAALPMGAAVAATVVLAACSGAGKAPAQAGAVQLSATRGPTSSRPTWSTSTACPSGLQGSAIFREVHRDGVSTNSISPTVDDATAPFHGTLQAPISMIKAAGGIPNGSTQKLVVICFSSQGGTGTSRQVMNLYITYSADGSSYTTSATAPAGS
jgi:hypothetical protein